MVIIGLSVLLLAGGRFAVFDACVADPTCNASASSDTLEGYLAQMVAGVVLVVVGAPRALIRERAEP